MHETMSACRHFNTTQRETLTLLRQLKGGWSVPRYTHVSLPLARQHSLRDDNDFSSFHFSPFDTSRFSKHRLSHSHTSPLPHVCLRWLVDSILLIFPLPLISTSQLCSRWASNMGLEHGVKWAAYRLTSTVLE